jgi:GNAT superfamily N-acetyltransferase
MIAHMTVIAPLQSADRTRWEELARGYKAFYRTHTPDEAYDETWRRLLDERSSFHGLGAYVDGKLVGITHYLFHPMFWYGDTCYLQDLFVAEESRGHGAARAMIEEVAERTRAAGATRLYWTTQEDNLRARVLYDKVARYSGFIKYDYPLLAPIPATHTTPAGPTGNTLNTTRVLVPPRRVGRSDLSRFVVDGRVPRQP